MNRKHSERCGKLAHITFNQVVLGSSPSGLTKQNHILTANWEAVCRSKKAEA